jgi:amino acid adenylation domain-containing protein
VEAACVARAGGTPCAVFFHVVQPNLNAANMLWHAAAIAGPAPAIVERDFVATYNDLVGDAGAIASSLRLRGIGRGARVGILLPRGAESAAALFGVMTAGCIAVVMDDVARPRQWEHILKHSGADCLITSADVLARQPRAIEATAAVLDVASLRSPRRDCAPEPLPGSTTAVIVYTSGTTGASKGVMVSHSNLASLTSAVNGYLELSSSDRLASLLPFSFVYGLGQLLCAISNGATLVLERSPLATQVAHTLRDRGVTVVAGVPALWTRLLATPGFRDSVIPSLRVMTNAGGALSPASVRALRSAQPQARLFLMYGLTEALRCTYLSWDEVDAHPDSIGRPIPGSEVFVVKDDGTPAAVGEVGELVFGGPTVTNGYWGDAEGSARVFRPRPQGESHRADERFVFSGDLVRRDEEGLLYFVGRRDRIIKTMGYRVSPHEVISVLHESGEVVDAEVIGEPDAEWGTTLVAYVVLRPHATMARLREFCRRELPRYSQPSRFVVREELPLTRNGKHDLVALTSAVAPQLTAKP